MNKYIFGLFILILQVGILSAQEESDFIATQSAKKSLQQAQKLVNLGKLKLAKKQLNHTIKIKEDFAVAYRELGTVCLELGDYDDATKAYESSFDLDDKLSRAAFFECGEAYFKLANAESARYYYEKYKEMKHKSYANKQKESGLETGYDLLLPERERNLAYISQLPPASKDLPEAINLGSNINSEQQDFLAAVTNAADIMIYTRTDRQENQNILMSRKRGGKWTKSQEYGKEINTNNNEGMAKLEAHGKRFYFAGCFRDDSEGGCDIYEAGFDNGKITSTNKLEGNLNSKDWDSQPSITCDGSMLYFTSNREGGQGGADIWASQRNPDGSWGAPYNLGPSINSDGDEEGPYISNDGSTLYFTSTGHEGQGDGDLFISRWGNEQWSPAENMGYPFNTPAKEIGFFIHADGKTAYFSSARQGGEGKLDIYKIELPEKYRPAPTILMEGHVVDIETKDPVPSYMKISREEENRYVQTDEKGYFFLCLPGNKGYSFQINEKGYDYFIDARFVASSGDLAPTEIMLELTPKQKAAKPKPKASTAKVEEKSQFFFESNSYSLTHQDLLELESLAKVLNQQRSWSAEVVGYASQTGTKEYNKWLSEQRAQKIMAYLRKQGVANDQIIKIEGKGASTGDGKNMRRVDVIIYSGR